MSLVPVCKLPFFVVSTNQNKICSILVDFQRLKSLACWFSSLSCVMILKKSSSWPVQNSPAWDSIYWVCPIKGLSKVPKTQASAKTIAFQEAHNDSRRRNTWASCFEAAGTCRGAIESPKQNRPRKQKRKKKGELNLHLKHHSVV